MVKNLKLLREKKGISQATLAANIGVSQQSINKYENTSTQPDIDTLIEIAKYFNTSIDYLVGNSEIDHVIENVTEDHLNEKERKIMNNYRSLDNKQQAYVEETLEIFNNK